MNVVFLDLGNTRIKWWSGGMVSACAYDQLDQVLNPLFANLGPAGSAVFASVVNDVRRERFLRLATQYPSVRLFECVVTEKAVGVNCGYRDVTRFGVDRWLSVVAGWSLYRKPFVVVDLGTAATLDFVGCDGNHLGGYIVPGLNLGIKALLAGTDNVKVDQHQLRCASRLPGTSTVEAVSHGAVAAIAALIEASLVGHQIANPGALLLLTGGDAPLVAQQLQCHYLYKEDLLFTGMVILHSEGLTRPFTP